MTGTFDPIRAVREEVQGLLEVKSVLAARERRAQQTATEAESEYNALVKLRGFVDAEIARKREVVLKLEAERDGR